MSAPVKKLDRFQSPAKRICLYRVEVRNRCPTGPRRHSQHFHDRFECGVKGIRFHHVDQSDGPILKVSRLIPAVSSDRFNDALIQRSRNIVRAPNRRGCASCECCQQHFIAPPHHIELSLFDSATMLELMQERIGVLQSC